MVKTITIAKDLGKRAGNSMTGGLRRGTLTIHSIQEVFGIDYIGV
jgi:hypothetical protein